MKKGRSIMLLVCALTFTMVFGIFIGRNLNDEYAPIPDNRKQQILEQKEIINEDYRLDMNKATKAQLMDLPGIGETIADRIISYRSQNGDFTSTNDLLLIDGIGEKKLLQIEALIKVGG